MSNLCSKCNTKEIAHKRAKMCSYCYREKRRLDWKINEEKRQARDPNRKARLLKHANDMYYSKYRANRLAEKKECSNNCGNFALKGSRKVLCRACSDESIRKNKVAYQVNRKKNDLSTRLRENVKTRIKGGMKGKYESKSIVKYLGCSVEELKQHLESQFHPGMSWDNYGFEGWHIDHIKPLASFDLTDEKQVEEALHYTNLQPLWAVDNFKKGCKIE